MEIFVFIAVLFAAFLHAFWNFLVKDHDDKALGMLALMCGHVPFALVGLLVAGLPGIDALGYIIAGSLLHLGYSIFLMNAYRFGALSTIYPFARGTSPLLLLVWTLAFGTDSLGAWQIAGAGMVAAALMCFGLFQYRDSAGAGGGGGGLTGLWLALATGFFIASYSVVDALGTRVTGNPLSFFGVIAIVHCVMIIGYFRLRHPGTIGRMLGEGRRTFWLGGGLSYCGYAIILWACIHAPIAVVSSVRETSVVIAILLGAVLLKERLTVSKLGAGLMVLAGLVLLRLG